MVAVAQDCERTKNHRIVYFEREDSMVCELYLNKTQTKKKSANHLAAQSSQSWGCFPSDPG